ncbi:MAG: ATP-binding protein [Gemmataceae bacterium]
MARLVLLVETSTSSAALRQYLWHLGYHVYRVAAERDFLDHARRLSPELIVVDAPDSCRRLRLHPDLGDTAVVQLQADEAGPGLRIDPDAVVCRPLTLASLSAAIERALQVQRWRRAEAIEAELNAWVPSDLEELDQLHDLLPGWLAGCGLTPFQVQQTTQAVREVVANAIEWGHACVRSRLVRVECLLDVEKVSILVRDNGPGFDRANLPHAARPGDPLTHLEVRAARRLREGGFGILLAHGLVDFLCYSESGNEGLLVKYLPLRQRLATVSRRPSFSLSPVP